MKNHSFPLLHYTTQKVPVLDESLRVSDALAYIAHNARELKSIHYIYIVNDESELKGVISLRDLYQAALSSSLQSIHPHRKICAVSPYAHISEVLKLVRMHDLLAVPVVGEDNRLLGVLMNDTIREFIHKESREHLLRLVGISNRKSHPDYDDIMTIPVSHAILHRLPWLVIGLFGGVFTSTIVGSFEEILSRHIILASFIPLIVYMSDAVGTQMEAYVVRDFSLNNKISFLKYLFKQLRVVFILSLSISTVLFLYSTFIHTDLRLTVVISLALFLAVMSSVVTGIMIPFAFRKVNIDPANASGPIATIIQDALSVVIYFLIASSILG